MLDWFNSREAARVGASLADEFAPRSASVATSESPRDTTIRSLEQLLRRADGLVRSLHLNFYKKAKFANSFKWRLIENGLARESADAVTKSLVLHLSQGITPGLSQDSTVAQPGRDAKLAAKEFFGRGNACFKKGAYADAAALYEQAISFDASHAESLNNLGSSLLQLGRYHEAERYFRQSIAIKPNFPDPHGNLGILLRTKSELVGAEVSLRRALKLKPTYVDARINLGLTVAYLGRLRDARAYFAKVLKGAPGNVQALYGMGQIAALEGRFDEAEKTFKRIIDLEPRMPAAWGALAGIRKMTIADSEWFQSVKQIAASGVHPTDEANLRFAMGKYCDDVNDFEQAFQNYKRGNELLRSAAEPYDREARTNLISSLISTYSPEAISKMAQGGGSVSAKPVFVLGMPRSGTSLAEQIIASHPAAYGAGELAYWDRLVVDEPGLSRGILPDAARVRVAEEYLRVLDDGSADVRRVIDKAPTNSDYLGIIYSVFPNARVIYMQRDPIDTCLSCYFQHFLTGLNFTLDLSDLVHYCREHQRIMAHWRSVLPAGFMLEVPYEQLVADQETWSRKMLEFIGLDWDDRCLEFHKNNRQVVTASAWQVRQKIYQSSVARWHNYEKHIGPLKTLKR
jgi:tetratricopeptide (TPR) repeat protein